jgi:porphobilinogen synthase
MRETRLSVDDLVMPLFVCPGKKVRNPIEAMPGTYRLSIDELVKEAELVGETGIRAILLFGIPGRKDTEGRVGCSPKGIVQRAVRELKKRVPGLYVITDVCNCAYTTHGHCGPVADGDVDNDRTLAILCKQALSHAQAGADMVAPSDMMDGRVGRIRRALDDGGFSGVSIMSYAAKYASAFYGPFRNAADSAPRFGDRRTYQMDPANGDEALREVALDIEEGADTVMVKPALSYLDVVRRVKDRFDAPVAAYNVSGVFSMVKAAAAKGWVNEQDVMMEMLTSIKRAGADVIITYYGVEAAKRLRGTE